ncbi:peptide/nickel transport system ATP-binding protein/dipeptide transport system ATP-binding protein [Dongia mobilis]|uniref:Peptide/nickel transport system ATP-binding protein/dipeptide transport system ATP-binding protein n=1 Tax=Dongia mobilis TaxID=578943 RepID=A0A4R6WV98_9PROT|nr:ABC transporter ATP-binding protein [Dongia mobilis]TDQ83002.1 peptide/nickel transport system ATP-binding protein/dipeptide transport system ATP-binding protein [Dongia mobilis]
MALLTVENLGIDIHGIRPLDGVSFSVDKGEILGIVGESGSGKSLTALSVIGLLPLIGGRILRGSIRFDGIDLATLPEAEFRRLRGRRIAFITQNPMTSLDPVMRIGAQIDQVSMLHLGLDARAAQARSIEIMAQLRIPEAATIYHHFPHQLSGGMKQRIVIAMALAADPDLIIADEPTTALDVTIQAQIVDLLVELVRERDVALILITHDMGVVAQTCDRVVVLYAGRVAESDAVAAIFERPRHPYTRALIGCIPRDETAHGNLTGIPGAVPSVAHYPAGCRFHPRCPRRGAPCDHIVPVSAAMDGGLFACHFPENSGVAR